MELMDIVAELKNASVQMPEEKIDQFIEAVDTHERIFVYGTGRSGLMLKALAMRLMQMGLLFHAGRQLELFQGFQILAEYICGRG